MNIPYDDFYAAEGISPSNVDAVTTASTSMWKAGHATGSYTSPDEYGGYGAILGIKYPVKIKANDYIAFLNNREELREELPEVLIYGGNSYNQPLDDTVSYSTTVLSELPAAYKAMTKSGDEFTFGKIVGQDGSELIYDIDESIYIADLNLDVGSATQYGEYQFNWNISNNNNFPVSGTGMAGIPNATSNVSANASLPGIKLTDGSFAQFQIVGAIFVTDGLNSASGDNGRYAMRPLENIWWGSRYGLEISIPAGITEYHHTSSKLVTAPYLTIMGETVSSIIFITDKGYFTFDWNEYLQIIPKPGEYTLIADDADISTGITAITAAGLDAYDTCTVSGPSAASITANWAGRALTWTAAVPGSYTLFVTDSTGRYAEISTTFMLTTAAMPAVYDPLNSKLIADTGYSQSDVDAYISSIISVTVDGKSYAPSGRGSVQVIKTNGEINAAASCFTESGAYSITVTSAGYSTPLSFTYTKP